MNQIEAGITRTASGEEHAGKYLTFRLGDEEYGIEILKVQEIILMQKVTGIPRVPSRIRGIINLRGNVIPIVSLRETFGMEHVDDTEKTCIIVISLTVADVCITTGIIIDEVHEVRDITSEQIEPPPLLGLKNAEEFIRGIGKVEKKVILLLDIRRIISTDDINQFATENRRF